MKQINANKSNFQQFTYCSILPPAFREFHYIYANIGCSSTIFENKFSRLISAFHYICINIENMPASYISSQIYDNFNFTATPGQRDTIEALSGFLISPVDDPVFILNGYAGTGKTTLIAALVKTLKGSKMKPVLLAPTGRAAKVMTRYAGEKAYTIHKKIYRQKSLAAETAEFSLNQNKDKGAVYIVDEASMLSDTQDRSAIFGSGNLLRDLISYIHQGTSCKLILVGDAAQLPPVGSEQSPALMPSEMSMYGNVTYVTMDEVVRQESESGILFNATLVRCMLDAGIIDIPIFDTSFPDVASLEGGEILEAIESAYSHYGKEETLIITRSNKRANRFNEAIRKNVFFAEEEIESGDMLMVVKNNYHYTERMEDAQTDFIANGDTAILRRIHRFEDMYGFSFADSTLSFPDHDDMELRCRIILDALSSESPALSPEQNRQLFWNVAEDYAEVKSKAKRYREVRENPHFNALQVKFAYAVTCHKAQGGQWKCVFVDRMLFGEEIITRDLMRWLYTAITRATEKLYFINFDERFFG